MANQIKVRGKAQNRTALGILHAYLILHPETTLEQLQAAFPASLNPNSGEKKLFFRPGDKDETPNWNGFFEKEDELLTLGDGQKVALASMWTKASFERLVEWVKPFGIEVARFEKADGAGKKGSYEIEYLDGFVPPVIPAAAAAPAVPEASSETPAKRRRCRKWWLWLLILLLILLFLFLLLRCCNSDSCCKKAPAEETVLEEVIPEAAPAADEVSEEAEALTETDAIASRFNAASFPAGASTLNADARAALDDLVTLMQQHPGMKVRVVGHTSPDGSAEANQRLSERRARAVADHLVAKGISPSRVRAEGKGSTELLDPAHPETNRRTEIIVE